MLLQFTKGGGEHKLYYSREKFKQWLNITFGMQTFLHVLHRYMNLKLHQDAIKQEIPEKFAP